MAKVQSAQLPDDRIHHGLHLGLVGHVALQSDDLAAGSFSDFLCGSLGGGNVHDGDIEPRLSKNGGGVSQSPGSPPLWK